MARVSTAASIFVAMAAACAPAPQAEPEPDLAGDEPEVVAARSECARDDYDAAFLHYKTAIDHAKERARGDACSEGTTLLDIASDLGAAVARCSRFEGIIASSRWAEPARRELRGNLALAALTGKLRANEGSGRVVIEGASGALASGVTLFGPSPGAYGNTSKLAFRAGGAATFSKLEVGDDELPTWSDVEASWSLAEARDGEIEVTLTMGRAPTRYRFTAAPRPAPYEAAPAFVLVPIEGGDALDSMPSECGD